MERELLAQQTKNHRRLVETVAVALAREHEAAALPATARQLFESLHTDGWYLFASSRQPLAAESDPLRFPPDYNAVAAARLGRTPVVTLDYRPGWLPRGSAESFLQITQPLQTAEGEGVLQVRFNLAEVDGAVIRARHFFLTFLILYLVVLVGFGSYLLGRTVIRPMMELRRATGRVADGRLDELVPVTGPAEIGELAGDFNRMMTTLSASRREVESSIRSLQQANDELRRTQAELVRAEKLASVGRLAAGMAHEIGNPLGAVVGYLDFLRKQQAQGSSAADILSRSQDELARIDRLVRDLLDYAAPERSDAAAQCDPLTALAEARDLLAHQGVFEGVTVETELPPRLPLVRIPCHRLVQVLVNLLLNARDALAGSGTIRLAAASEGEGVFLAVSDTGPGIAAAALEQIFDPFFTTKDPGRGRGLGLAVCHRIVTEAGGRIEAVSQPREGSTFRIFLPGCGERA